MSETTEPNNPPRDVDSPWTFPPFKTLAEWEERRRYIRQQILVSCGLYPLPEKVPLNTNISGRISRNGYTIENVYFQTFPGFYLAGNLYRPDPAPPYLNHESREPYPGVLVTHGHWPEGRFADGPNGSIPARAITFARQGYVAFTYDMAGYNDTRQVEHRKYANDRQHWLWGVSMMGLQTWNSICALDFLCSLDDVDQKRLAITGESGGGTQTMILGAIDDRLAAVGPCVMVSHSYQGGCLCENAPGLRVDFSNMEIAATAAPRFQIMVGATGDWTRSMMEVEGPAVKTIYELYGAPERLDYVRFPYNHNINQDSREAVYRFFGKHLLHQTDETKLREPPYKVEPVETLQVFPPSAPLPADAVDSAGLTRWWMNEGIEAVEKLKPTDKRSLRAFKETLHPAWQHTLALHLPAHGDIHADEQPRQNLEGCAVQPFDLHRTNGLGVTAGKSFILAASRAHDGRTPDTAVILVHPDGMAHFTDPATGKAGPLVRSLLAQRKQVTLVNPFLIEKGQDAAKGRDDVPFDHYFTTYNRTLLQERVQALVTTAAYLRFIGIKKVLLASFGEAGLWALLAAPTVDGVAADCAGLNLEDDDLLCRDDLFIPGLRRLGDFRTAATLAAPHPLLLHNTGPHFSAAKWIAEVYHSLNAGKALRVEQGEIGDGGVVGWLNV